MDVVRRDRRLCWKGQRGPAFCSQLCRRGCLGNFPVGAFPRLSGHHTPATRGVQCWDQSPPQQWLQCPNGPCWTPHTSHSHTQPLCSPWFQPRFPTAESQMSDSIKPFIPSAVTQEWPELFLQQKSPSVLSPHSLQPKAQVWLFLPSPQLLLGLSVSLPQLCHHPCCPLLCFVGTRALVSGSHLELNLHLALQLPPATCTRCVHNQEEGRVRVRWFQFCLCYSACCSLGNC